MQNILSRLQEGGYLEAPALEKVRAAVMNGIPLDECLKEASRLSEEQWLQILASEMELDYLSLEDQLPSREYLKNFPVHLLLERKILPLKEEAGVVLVATNRVFDQTGIDELRVYLNQEVRPVLAPGPKIEQALKKLLGVGADTVQSLISDSEETPVTVLAEEMESGVDLSAAAEDASIIRFVNQILKEAIELRATDVHFEPFENELRVRYRIDGVLQAAAIPAEIRRFQAAIVSRLKILSSLDIAEKRLPQDGRIKLMVTGREIDVRVSVIPMMHGEAVVLRLLDRSAPLLGLAELGMSDRDRHLFDRLLDLPHGIILVTGPTGSGKTTTLYAGLSRINTMERKIITIEDPIEYHLPGINQIQVQTKTSLTFARGLRSVLRHDPDVILIGEIRDLETAEIAVQASLTGHLVFSTLHTNDAPSAPTRLVDMGVEPYLVASSLEGVIAQRLVRLICQECIEEVSGKEVELLRKRFGEELPAKLYRGRGCSACQGTGYWGRTGIFEFLPVYDQVRSLILTRSSAQRIRQAGLLQGMRSLREDGWRVVREGRTTVDEVLRVTKDEKVNGHGLEFEPSSI
ncbi:MAG: Flp pilus assembly complex ATPase component TadA [Candidatus Omnitrophica bacterium]|nr:Flp pilus assembly complex ATPase component TadA [Candidatus Omnitrophota bacterium]